MICIKRSVNLWSGLSEWSFCNVKEIDELFLSIPLKPSAILSITEPLDLKIWSLSEKSFDNPVSIAVFLIRLHISLAFFQTSRSSKRLIVMLFLKLDQYNLLNYDFANHSILKFWNFETWNFET